jgi:hypothetical protein
MREVLEEEAAELYSQHTERTNSKALDEKA